MRFAVLVLLLGGCEIYGGGDDECVYNDRGGVAESVEYRDPYTGQCQYFGGYDCPDPCAPCTTTGQALPDWGLCYGRCDALAEQTCLTTSGCYAAYELLPNDGRAFFGCWDTAMSGPIQGGNCSGLDAHECSRHDDCTATFTDLPGGTFYSCANELQSPDPGECNGTITCTSPAPACPPNTTPGIKNGCYTGYCIPLTDCPLATCESLTSESTCIARADCAPVYEGTNCTCNLNGCSCQVLTYDHCQTR